MASTLTRPEGFRGEFLLPSDPAYDKYRRPWNADHEHKKPSVVLLPLGATDVQVAVNWVRSNNLQFAVMSGGHSISGRSVKDGAVLIRLTRMNFVHVDPEERTAWVGMGATVKDFDLETNAFNLCGVGGQVSHTGMGGFTLHGGYGAISRRYGLGVDNILAARVVLADGTMVEATETKNPDLFFAIRGAASSIGIVTSLKVRLYPLPEKDMMCSGQAFWIAESDEEFADRVRKWAEIVDKDEPNLYCSMVIDSPPPPPFNGRRTFIIHTAWLGDEPMQQAQELMNTHLAPLMDKKPLINAIDPKPYAVFNCMQDVVGGYGHKKRSTGASTDDCQALVKLILASEKYRTPASVYLVEHWGGQIVGVDRKPEDDLVYGTRRPYSVMCLGNLDDPSTAKKSLEWLQQFKALAKDIGVGVAAYVNYTDDHNKPYGDCTQKLADVKAKYDPHNLFPKFAGM
ncbi:hypothetical protein PTSG_10465 [Salpingoeca rosetta]|uniref:FAD-binding PCMH-type domain-containing protein n=1 Tax=Salpingoeca rosetta (strain ATCC 50818 / BSB-021) TaxID=946362 RepID=F2UPR3_SALR5|nr:uncharacterized protein PTSG_10465 [Salpingoeca rosetta]EGD79618.1 hypothetical protein PTSG_10465 [Salpingoeca rosetta]|eukprot:XP_004988846.1 hypothetical protein PTSG_10465 [Salpingoeca rosetta]